MIVPGVWFLDSENSLRKARKWRVYTTYARDHVASHLRIYLVSPLVASIDLVATSRVASLEGHCIPFQTFVSIILDVLAGWNMLETATESSFSAFSIVSCELAR